MSQTGYERDVKSDEPYFHYRVDSVDIVSGSKRVAIVFRNDRAMGTLECLDEEEYRWLKNKLTGSRKPSASESG